MFVPIAYSRVLVQRRRQDQPRLAWLHAAITGRTPSARPSARRSVTASSRPARDGHRDGPRHAGVVRAGAPPVPRPGRHQPADLPADGHARGRAGRRRCWRCSSPSGVSSASAPSSSPHVMFCVCFVVVTVKARLASLDPRLEEAAMDLYASDGRRSCGSRFPLVAAGHRGGGPARVLPVVRRLHHHELQLGHLRHLPEVRLRARRPRGIPPQANVIGTFMFVAGLRHRRDRSSCVGYARGRRLRAA